MPKDTNLLHLTPKLPPDAEALALLKVMQGVPYRLYRKMYNEIRGQAGVPQEQEE